MNKLGVAIDVDFDPRFDVVAGTHSSAEVLNPAVPLDRVINMVRLDSVREPRQYLDETEVQDGGE